MNSSSLVVSRGLLLLVAGTTAFDGLRAGAGTFRALIDLPARRTIGPLAFAAFSRATDLSSMGVAFYVLYGVGGALLTAATWLVARRTAAPPVVRRLCALAATSSLLILIMTSQAAPLMWRLRSTADDPAMVGDLLDRFTVWTNLRVLCADLSFLAMLSTLVAIALKRSTTVTT